jgi:hypothetical protein
MQKRVGVVLGVLILMSFLSLGFISSVGCEIVARTDCSGVEEHIVMGLSGLTNAHGELPDVEDYDNVLCCDFGTGDTVCRGTNKIIGLSSSTNAHAEIPNQDNYDADICYEDLECTSLTLTGIDCGDSTNGDYPIDVLSLTGWTNAHIGNVGDYLDVSICCDSDEFSDDSCELADAYWSLDGSTELVSDDNPVLNGQDVFLIVEGTNCEGESISFEVLENQGTSMSTFSSNYPSGTWQTSWMDDGLFQGNPEYYFTATFDTQTIDSQDIGNELLEVEEDTPIDWCVENFIDDCADYDEAHCEVDVCEVADVSAPGAFECEVTHSCSCAWDSDDQECKSNTVSLGTCDDGILDEGEACDLDTFFGEPPVTCETFYGEGTGGTLACSEDCSLPDTSGCEGPEGECDGGEINNGETCDGTIFAEDLDTCQEWGFEFGILACNECQIDTSWCGNPIGEPGCTWDQIIVNACDVPPMDLMTIRYTAEGENCENLEDEIIPCPAQAQLPFFGWFGLVLSVLLITTIYLVVAVKKKKK